MTAEEVATTAIISAVVAAAEPAAAFNTFFAFKMYYISLLFITSARRAEEGHEMQVVRTSTYVLYSTYLSFQLR